MQTQVVNQILDTFYTAIKKSIEEFVLPTGKHLIPATAIAAGIFGVTVVCKIFNLPTLLSIPGSGIGLGVLCLICFIERRERSEVSKLYRVVAQSVSRIAGGKKRPSTDKPNQVAGSNNTVSDSRDGNGQLSNDNSSGVHTAASEGSRPAERGSKSISEGSNDRDLD